MIKLYGFSLSNYYNKVKLALLEKGIPFEEVMVNFREGEAQARLSPLGKVPYIETEDGPLSESQVILEYLEAKYPQVPLLPADPWQAAKVRELITYIELHVELTARQLYTQAYFGGSLPEKFTGRVREDLERHLAALARLFKPAPFAAGASFSAADCAAYVHLPIVAFATKLVYGEDLVTAAGIEWRSYVKFIEQRPHAQKVAADRKADQARRAGSSAR